MTPEATAPSSLAPPPDLAWIVGAKRVAFRQSKGGLMTSDETAFDVRREGGRFSGVATAGGRDMYGTYTARMWKLDFEEKGIDAALRVLAGAEPGRPDTRRIIVEGSDTYLAWSITIDDVDACEARSCRPRRSIRLTSEPDGHDFYYWYAWTGLEPVALDRTKPDLAAAALAALLRAP